MLLSSGDNVLLWEADAFNGWESQGIEALTGNLGSLMTARFLG